MPTSPLGVVLPSIVRWPSCIQATESAFDAPRTSTTYQDPSGAYMTRAAEPSLMLLNAADRCGIEATRLIASASATIVACIA